MTVCFVTSVNAVNGSLAKVFVLSFLLVTVFSATFKMSGAGGKRKLMCECHVFKQQ